jgi:hypothetical protein
MACDKTYSSLIETALVVITAQRSRFAPTATSPLSARSIGSFLNLVKESSCQQFCTGTYRKQRVCGVHVRAVPRQEHLSPYCRPFRNMHPAVSEGLFDRFPLFDYCFTLCQIEKHNVER